MFRLCFFFVSISFTPERWERMVAGDSGSSPAGLGVCECDGRAGERCCTGGDLGLFVVVTQRTFSSVLSGWAEQTLLTDL